MRSTLGRRGFWAGGMLGALVATGLIVTPDLVSGTAGAQDTAGRAGSDIVLLRCKSAGQQFAVSSYQGSASTPARKTESCAETLAEMAKAGFVIDRAGHSQDADFVLYTLIR